MASPKFNVIPFANTLPKTSGQFDTVYENAGLDWVHPSVAVRDTGRIGLGLFALEFIPKGSTIILFGGKLMTWREVATLPEDMQDIPFQVSDDIVFGIAKREEIGVGERINHSCDPNCGFVSEMRLIAIRDIEAGDDVTFDYATCTSIEWCRLDCGCGSRNCRVTVTGNDWKLPEIQRRLRRYYQPYLQEKLRRRNGGLRDLIANLLRMLANLISPSKKEFTLAA